MNHTCFECQKEFSSKEALDQHKKLVHPNAKSKSIWPWIVGAVAVVLAIVIYSSMGSGQYDSFTKCISDSGAKFYGAFWCSHCTDQKAMFGASAKYLPYVECSTSDGKGELPVCNSVGITGYPTWIFADGSRNNIMNLEELSQKTSCALPA